MSYCCRHSCYVGTLLRYKKPSRSHQVLRSPLGAHQLRDLLSATVPLVGISWEMVINYYGKMAILLGIFQEMVIF